MSQFGGGRPGRKPAELSCRLEGTITGSSHGITRGRCRGRQGRKANIRVCARVLSVECRHAPTAEARWARTCSVRCPAVPPFTPPRGYAATAQWTLPRPAAHR